MYYIQDELFRIVHEYSILKEILHEAERVTCRKCAIAGGAVRNIIWAHLQGVPLGDCIQYVNDIDVVYYDNKHNDWVRQIQVPDITLQIDVINTYSFTKGSDIPCNSIEDAACTWCETASCILYREDGIFYGNSYTKEDIQNFIIRQNANAIRLDDEEYNQRRISTYQKWKKKFPRLQIL